MASVSTLTRGIVALAATTVLVALAFALDRTVTSARVVAVIETARVLAADGEFTAAHSLMEPLVGERARAGDTAYVELYHEVTARWASESATKAHVQHGHEGPGGTLAPSDIVP